MNIIFKKNNFKLLNIILILLSFFFLSKWLKMAYFYENTIHTSSDFGIIIQSAKELWLNKTDIYKLSLEYFDNPQKYSFEYIFNSRYPHLFYLILFPITFFEIQLAKLIWFMMNIIFLILITNKLVKIYNIKKMKIILFFIFCSSVPLENCLTMGQTSLFTLYFMLVYFYNNSSKSLYLILCGIKYSLSLYLILFSLIREKKYFFYLIMINIFAVLIFNYLIGSYSLLNFISPMLVALKTGSTNSFGNITNFIFFRENYYLLFSFYSLIIILLIQKKIIDFDNESFIFLLLSALIFVFAQGMYSYVLTFPIVAYTFSKKSFSFTDYIVCLYIFFLFYYPYLRHFDQKLFDLIFYSNISSFLGIIVLSLFFFRIRNLKKKKFIF